MTDFKYYTPTEVAFGRESESRLPELLRRHGAKKVLLHYGGGSAERSGLLPAVRKALKDNNIEFVELGGVVPNPRLSLVREGIDLVRREGVDFILAVGGGSVVDSSKAIGYGARRDGDVWDLFMGRATAETAMPVGVVLTIPAAGSEMSNSCVITCDKTGYKRSYADDVSRPRFAIMNPERSFTLPAYQTACGVTDIIMHTLERYFTPEEPMELTSRLAEGLMRTVMEAGRKALENPEDYDARAEIMWASSLSHNGLTGCGATMDFGTHRLEHELSALFDVAHGAGLAAVWPHWARYVVDINPARFARLAVNVLGVEPADDDRETALRGIDAMADYFKQIGMPVSIPELLGRKVTDDEIETMADRCTLGRTITVGNFLIIDHDRAVDIFKLANN